MFLSQGENPLSSSLSQGANLQELAAGDGLGPRQTDDERDARRVLRGDREDPLGDLVAAGDAAEDVDEDRLHARIREHDLERGLHDRFLRPTADVEEVRGAAAGIADGVERSHDQAGAVPDDPHVAVQLDVAEPKRARLLL